MIQRYHVGLRSRDKQGEACPFQYISVAGHTFHLFTEKIRGEGVETQRDRIQGGYLFLSPEDLREIRFALDHKLRVQWVGSGNGRHGREVHLLTEDVWKTDRDGRLVLDVNKDPILESRRGQAVGRGLRGREGDYKKLHGWIYMIPAPAQTPFEWEDPLSVDETQPWEKVTHESKAPSTPRIEQPTREQLTAMKNAELLELLGSPEGVGRTTKKETLVDMVLERQSLAGLASPEGGAPAWEQESGGGDEDGLEAEEKAEFAKAGLL